MSIKYKGVSSIRQFGGEGPQSAWGLSRNRTPGRRGLVSRGVQAGRQLFLGSRAFASAGLSDRDVLTLATRSLEADCELVSQEMQRLLDWLARFRLGVDGGGFRFAIDCATPEDMNTRAERDARIAGAAGCFLDRKYAEETYGIRLGERSAVMPGTQEGFSDSPAMPGEQPKRKRPTASDRRMMKICASAIGSLVDADALEAYRGAVERASRNAFGDIPEGLDGHELLEEFKKRAPAFLATLPGAMDGLKEDQLAKALANAMTASAMNSTLPPSFWKTSPLSRAGSRDS